MMCRYEGTEHLSRTGELTMYRTWILDKKISAINSTKPRMATHNLLIKHKPHLYYSPPLLSSFFESVWYYFSF